MSGISSKSSNDKTWLNILQNFVDKIASIFYALLSPLRRLYRNKISWKQKTKSGRGVINTDILFRELYVTAALTVKYGYQKIISICKKLGIFQLMLP